MSQPENLSENEQNPLTGILEQYTVSATQTDEVSEVDEMMVHNFLQALSEVALTVASRNAVNHAGEEASQ